MGLESLIVHALGALPEPVQRRLAGPPVTRDGQTLQPEVQLMLRLGERTGHKTVDEQTVEEARARIEHDARVFAGRPLPVARVEDHVAGGRPARLYVPPGGPVPAPLLVYLHGGGWVVGSLDSHDQTCRFLAREARTRVLAVDYRLAPEHPFPAAAEDALAAFAWAVEHAAELGCDPERVSVAGDSAGGNLAAVVGREARPLLQVLIYPVTHCAERHPSRDTFGEGFFLTDAEMRWYEGHYLPDGDARRDPRASPMLARDVRKAAPAYVAVAGCDPLRDEGVAYADRLREAGVPVTLRVHDGLVHGFANAVTVGRTARAAMEEVAAALRAANART